MECPVTYPLKEILTVYWERWEIEEGYGELKQRQLNNTARHGQVSIRNYGAY
ncbi:hypothetical protein XBI1_440001 [Xenorhabdus bovienii str. Intermedium]|uniref:Transposase n=1 Tax=Xenorhabdus bovienii str. Intermedium TaxID=1379677 RepID=A0A077QQB3_XENBV|nr:hypothetical protein XBI1_440001 [Xenorhabdus bovienii str. Intermedium]